MKLSSSIRIFFYLTLVLSGSLYAQSPSSFMWYTKPAGKWEEALPLGNGRLGAMIYGNAKEEVVQLNEDTYWTGGPYSTVVKGGHEKLKEIQELVFKGEMLKAHNMFGRYLMGYPVEQQKYQSLANLHLTFDHRQEPTEYKRWLDLNTATSGVDFTVDGVTYHREIFSSAPDQIIVIRLTASQPGSISFVANLQGVRNQTHSNYATDYFQMNGFGKDGLTLTGKSADYLGVAGKLKYEARLKVIPEGGAIELNDYFLTVKKANAVTILIAAATNFVNYKDVSANEHERVNQYFSNAEKKTYDELKQRHIADYQHFYNRVSISLPNTEASKLPTDKRIEVGDTGSDPQLAALAYNFGRYVLIGSSRQGTQPANLQGIWNNDMNPAWDSKYTTNINTEMNYWIAEAGNLTELSDPLFTMVSELTDQGAQVAKEHYGSKGWVFHQNTDLWRVAAPMDGPSWGTFTIGGAWLLNELWKRYDFSMDKKYAEKMYPMLKGSVEFFMDFLITHPNGKWLVTNPSTSPENFPAYPGNGKYFDEVTGSVLSGTTICAGSSMDMQVLTDLFSNFIEAANLHGVDKELVAQVLEKKSKLAPPQIAKDGALQEWAEDWGQMEKNHRHFSHLYGLYPGDVFSLDKTPQFISPIKAVLEQRGDGGAGWSRAWKVALWARLHDGDRAQKILSGYFKDQSYPQLFAKCFTPMQVDGTLGTSAAISEMLIQSHEGYLDFLPALPKEWVEGNYNGVCARGGFEIAMQWSKGKMTKATIKSKAGSTCKLKSLSAFKIKSGNEIIKAKQKGNLMEFATVAGRTYELTFSEK